VSSATQGFPLPRKKSESLAEFLCCAKLSVDLGESSQPACQGNGVLIVRSRRKSPGPVRRSRLRPSYEVTGRWGKGERAAIAAPRPQTLVCRYAIETGSGGESAYISEASKRAVLIDTENAD
jgi:hypothetical protein